MKIVLSKDKVDKLIKLGDECDCPLHLPPLLGRFNPFFDMSKILCSSDRGMKIISEVEKLNCGYRIHFVNKKKLMEITP